MGIEIPFVRPNTGSWKTFHMYIKYWGTPCQRIITLWQNTYMTSTCWYLLSSIYRSKHNTCSSLPHISASGFQSFFSRSLSIVELQPFFLNVYRLGEIEPFSTMVAQDELIECDQPRKDPLKYSAMVGHWTRAIERTGSEIQSFSRWAIMTDFQSLQRSILSEDLHY